MKVTSEYITWTRIDNDINGNPRYVCHYLAFKPYQDPMESYNSFSYEYALKVARSLGGRKFHNKQYGGGIVFQSYNIESLSDKILTLTGDAVYYSREPFGYESNHGNKKRKNRAFLLKDVLNKKGELKKWFYLTEYSGKKTLYSLNK